MYKSSQDNNCICIQIDYQNSENPSVIFNVLAELVNAFNEIDSALINSISPTLQNKLVLGDVQKGSIKVFLSNVLLSLDDEGLKNCDWKKLIGNYLYMGKYKALKMLQENGGLPLKEETGLPDRKQVDTLVNELQSMAIETDVKAIPIYQTVSIPRLLNAMFMVSTALAKLDRGDTVKYSANGSGVELNPEIVITGETVNAFLVKESKLSRQTYTIKVKRPDYLGESQWEFKLGNRLIKAKITDEAWLSSFQQRHIDVRPGDSIKAQVEVIVDYGFSGEILFTHYNIYHVLNVLNQQSSTQHQFLGSHFSPKEDQNQKQWSG